METIQFEPMSVGRIFDRAFAIYRNNFLRFFTIVAIIQVPIALLSAVSEPLTSAGISATQETGSEPPVAREGVPFDATAHDTGRPTMIFVGAGGMIFAAFLMAVGGMLSQAALIKSVSETYLGNEITVGQAYRFVLPKAVTLIAATILVSLVTSFGFLLLVVPGIIFGLWFFLTTPAIVVEHHSATRGMSRSKALAAGNLGKIFAVGLLAGLIAYAIVLPLSFLGGFVGTVLFGANTVLTSFVGTLASTLSQILATPIGAAASILLYYDLRIRKEGFDLQMLAQSMAAEQG